jgi:hypothetical protein
MERGVGREAHFLALPQPAAAATRRRVAVAAAGGEAGMVGTSDAGGRP